MKKILLMIHTVLFVLCLIVGQAAWADSGPDSYPGTDEQQSDSLFSMEELEDLVAPIALYPDPLIAQILPAATFVDQIDEAARYITEYGRYARIDRQYWDVSVKAVAHYPDVLTMMDQKYDWTVALGQAFINQNDDLMYAIQLLRQDARAAGNLVSNRQQQVVVEDGYISIFPAEPEMIYVPTYDPQVVYVERPSPGFGLITFGIGFTIGAWLNRDFDWREHKVFYHGWRGRPWIERARPHVQVRNNIYINQTNRVININKNVMRHDSVRFREQIRHDVQIRNVRQQQPGNVRRDQRPGERNQKRGGGPLPSPAVPSRPDASPRNQRPQEKNVPLGGKPTPVITSIPATQPPAHDQQHPGKNDDRRDQKLPGKSMPLGGKPAAVITTQPTPPAPVRDQQNHGKGDDRSGKQWQSPGVAPRPGTPTVPQQPAPRIETQHQTQGTGAVVPRPTTQPSTRDIYRGRDMQGTQPASRSGYGGYGSTRDATIYRERGKTSQENMRQTGSPAPLQQKAPATQQPQPQKMVPVQQPMQRTAPVQQPIQRPAPAQRPSVEQRKAPASVNVAPPQQTPQPTVRQAPESDPNDKENRRQRGH
ncbi:MAG: DUF3300 domain-containing protein [Desulfuromonadales bacterium]|nr:DUF3300 domain-containing protein [Desulfuromonadales bacterium]